MKAAREHCRFGFEPPRFTPADRLDQLDRVANAARKQIASDDDDAWILATDDLVEQLARLDEIERYLGVRHEAAS